MTIDRKIIWQEAKDYFNITLGLLLYTFGFTVFLLPYEIVTGGIAGIGAIVFYATKFPVQWTFFIINAVLIVAILVIQKDFSLIESVVYAFSTAIGFALALMVFAGLREQLALTNVPKGMRGMSIVLITAGLLSLAFMGFSGVDNGLKALFIK